MIFFIKKFVYQLIYLNVKSQKCWYWTYQLKVFLVKTYIPNNTAYYIQLYNQGISK